MVIVATVFHNHFVKVVTGNFGHTLEKISLQKKQRNAMLHLLLVTYDNQTKELIYIYMYFLVMATRR